MLIEDMTPNGVYPESAALDPTAPVEFDRSRLDLEGRSSEWLPPRDMWLINPYDKAQKIETPVDEFGLVDANKHIEIVMSKVSSEFKWPVKVLSLHHIYWKGPWFGFPSAGPDAEEFRELPIHKRLLSKVLENFLHLMSWAPDIPHRDVQHEVIESHRATSGLFTSLQIAVCHQRSLRDHELGLHKRGVILPPEYHRKGIAEKVLLMDGLGQHLEVIEARLDDLERVTPEFRLIEPDRSVLVDAARRKQYMGALGRLVVPKALPLDTSHRRNLLTSRAA